MRPGQFGGAAGEAAVRLRAELGRRLPRERDGDDLAEPAGEIPLAGLDEREEPPDERRRLARAGPGLDGEAPVEVGGVRAADAVARGLVGEADRVGRRAHGGEVSGVRFGAYL